MFPFPARLLRQYFAMGMKPCQPPAITHGNIELANPCFAREEACHAVEQCIHASARERRNYQRIALGSGHFP